MMDLIHSLVECIFSLCSTYNFLSLFTSLSFVKHNTYSSHVCLSIPMACNFTIQQPMWHKHTSSSLSWSTNFHCNLGCITLAELRNDINKQSTCVNYTSCSQSKGVTETSIQAHKATRWQ